MITLPSYIENSAAYKPGQSIEEIREKEGGTYGVSVRMNIKDFPVPSFSTSMTFDTDPKLKDKLIGIIHNEVDSIMTKGPSEENFNKAKEFLLKSYDQNQRENKYWSMVIRDKYEDNFDDNTKYKEILNGITIDKVRTVAKKFFDQGNIIEVVMSPAE